jgi:hypothetical protein
MAWWHDKNHPKWNTPATAKQLWLIEQLQVELGKNVFSTTGFTKRDATRLITQLQDERAMQQLDERKIYGLDG